MGPAWTRAAVTLTVGVVVEFACRGPTVREDSVIVTVRKHVMDVAVPQAPLTVA